MCRSFLGPHARDRPKQPDGPDPRHVLRNSELANLSCTDSDVGLRMGFGGNLFKGNVVNRFRKQRESPDIAVGDVVGDNSCSKAWTAWHREFVEESASRYQEKNPAPFSGSTTALVLITHVSKGKREHRPWPLWGTVIRSLLRRSQISQYSCLTTIRPPLTQLWPLKRP